MYITETIMYKISEALNIDVDDLRLRNLYQVGQRTPFLQEITEDFHIGTMLEQLTDTSDFNKRKAAIKEFNSKSRFKKRGISKIPSKFGLRCASPRLFPPLIVTRINASQLCNCFVPEPGRSLCQDI